MMSDSSTGSGSAKLVVFTWNIGAKEEAFNFACEHLSNQGSFVAALQEVPDDGNSQLSILMMVEKHRLKRLSGTTLAVDKHRNTLKSTRDRVVLLSSEDIEIDPIANRHDGDLGYDDGRRLAGVTLRSQSWQGLQILGIHGPSLMSYPDSYDRCKWGSCMRGVLDEFWKEHNPIVIMGDMNAHPWSREITGRDGLYAIRRKDWPSGGSTKLLNSEKRVTPLYNPMWGLLPDGDPDQRGTHFYEAPGDLRWHCLDQIIISEHLREHSSAPAVLTKLGNHDLVERSGKPNISDHLPLQMAIEIGKVPSCQTSASS